MMYLQYLTEKPTPEGEIKSAADMNPEEIGNKLDELHATFGDIGDG